MYIINSYIDIFTCYNLHEITENTTNITLRFDSMFSKSCTDLRFFDYICELLPVDLAKIVFGYLPEIMNVYMSGCMFKISKSYYHVTFDIHDKVYQFSSLHGYTFNCINIREHKYITIDSMYRLDDIIHILAKEIPYDDDHISLLNKFNIKLVQYKTKIHDIDIFLQIMCCLLIIIDRLNNIL